MMFLAFLARTLPALSMAKPACMKKTRYPERRVKPEGTRDGDWGWALPRGVRAIGGVEGVDGLAILCNVPTLMSDSDSRGRKFRDDSI